MQPTVRRRLPRGGRLVILALEVGDDAVDGEGPDDAPVLIDLLDWFDWLMMMSEGKQG